VNKPIIVFFSGRATYEVDGKEINSDGIGWLRGIAFQSAKEWLGRHFRYLEPSNSQHVMLDPIFMQTKGGSRELKGTVETIKSNDTSVGSGYYPLSPLEQIVLEVRHHLNSDEFLRQHKHLGEDVKVMGVRRSQNISLTIGISFIDKELGDARSYFDLKHQLEDELLKYVRGFIEKKEMNIRLNKKDLWINALDDEVEALKRKKQQEDHCYLTVLGTSAEHGDDGAVGRGNRVNGVSPYYKPVSLEAASGKNPVSHVGKLYNVLAFLAAKRVYEQFEPKLQETYVKLVSRIGAPIGDPALSALLYVADQSLSIQEQKLAEKILKEELAYHLANGKLRDEIVRGDYDHGSLLYLLE